MRTYLCIVFTALIGSMLHASTIEVPAQQPTIQAGINAAKSGDMVVVAPGTYKENINFSGKAITVESSGGAKATIIDGGNVAPVVTFSNNEGVNSILKKFTVQNGTSTINTQFSGGGIYINSASPTITGNVIQNNTACNDGAGIGVYYGSPVISKNMIRNNAQGGECDGGPGGGAIGLIGSGTAQIIHNRIMKNSWPGSAGAIILWAAGTPTVENNIFGGNSSPNGQGGAINIVNGTDATIVQNLFYDNTADQGGAIYLLSDGGSTGPVFVNNTIIGGLGVSAGSAVYAEGFDSGAVFYNNLIIGLDGQNALYCDGNDSPAFYNNDAYSPGGSGVQGACSDEFDQNSNLSLDPMFVNPAKHKYQLQSSSPVINAGDVFAPYLPKRDLAGKPRFVDGLIDIGAYQSE